MKQGKAGCCSADTTKRSDWARMSEGTSRITTQVGTNGNSWKPQTCHQGAISVAVREHFWVQLLTVEFISSILVILGGLRTFKVQPILTHHFLFENIKTMRDVIKQGQGEMSRCLVAWYFVRTTPTCLQTHFTLRTVKLTKLQHKPETELRLQIKSQVFPLKATQPRTFWTLSGASRICSLWESREFWETAGWSCRKPAEQRLSGSFSFCPGQRDGGCHGDRWLSPFTVMWAVPAGVGTWIHH